MEIKYQCPFCKDPDAVFKTEFWELQSVTTWFDIHGNVEETKDAEMCDSGPIPYRTTKCGSCGNAAPIEKFRLEKDELALWPVSLNKTETMALLWHGFGNIFIWLKETLWPWSRMPR